MSKIVRVHEGDYKLKVGSLTTPGSIVLDTTNSTDNIATGPGVTIFGNLTVTGTTSTVESENLIIRDNVILLNAGELGAGVTAADNSSGIQVDRGTLPDVLLSWYEPLDTFILKTEQWLPSSPALNLLPIATNSINTFGANLSLVTTGDGIITVAGTTDYENNVLDYPNLRKFFEISTVQRSNDISSVVTKEAHTLLSGDRIIIDCKSDASFTSLNSIILDVIDEFTITYSNVGNNTDTITATGILKSNPIKDDDTIPNMRAVADYGSDLQHAYKLYSDINTRVDNVLYVSKNGNDLNDGTTLARPKLTIRSAVEASSMGTNIFVKSGDYTEVNPIRLPEGVTVIGDNLRTVTIRPTNKTQDLFWVNNGSYLAHMTFKDHEFPSASVAFPTDGTVGVIHTSPYVQNCTSMTTTGTGMRVDGDHVSGLKSMVVDAFTQYNQGGIGIHMLNGGNTQLVSVFTICCDVGFLCESGGFTSITNSNSSFGNIGIKADGVSPVKYTGKVVSDASGTVFVLNGLTTRPNVGDAVKFENDPEFYTVRSSTPFTVASVEIQQPNYNNESIQAKNTRQLVLDNKNKVLSDMIDFLNESYPSYDFNQFKATRDGGYIIDAVVDDMILNNNYKTVQAGLAYYRASASALRSTQLVETIAAITFIKDSILGLLSQGLERDSIETNFDIVISIIQNGANFAPAYSYIPPTAFDQNRFNAKDIIQENREFLIEEGIAFLSLNYPLPFTYDQTACRRDIGLILDAITYDVLYTGNSQTADAADEYYGVGNLQIPPSEKQATIDTFNYIKLLCEQCIVNTPVPVLNTAGIVQDTTLPSSSVETAANVSDLFNIVTNLIENAYSSILTLDERKVGLVSAGTLVAFQQYSLVSSSGHTFEWIGAGTNINTALPYLGGVPIQENEVVEENGGKVYFTSTDQRGDFRIGEELVINRNSGTISGRTFSKSLYAIMTPYILAIGE